MGQGCKDRGHQAAVRCRQREYSIFRVPRTRATPCRGAQSIGALAGGPAKMAATNKCLARSNKSRTGVPATNKRPAARRNFLGTANWRDPVGGQLKGDSEMNHHDLITAPLAKFSSQVPPRGRPIKFTPERIQQIRNLVERGKSREEIAELIEVTVGSLQVTCSKLGISLRRPRLDNGIRLASARQTCSQ